MQTMDLDSVIPLTETTTLILLSASSLVCLLCVLRRPR